jgi:hypothetical protein
MVRELTRAGKTTFVAHGASKDSQHERTLALYATEAWRLDELVPGWGRGGGWGRTNMNITDSVSSNVRQQQQQQQHLCVLIQGQRTPVSFLDETDNLKFVQRNPTKHGQPCRHHDQHNTCHRADRCGYLHFKPEYLTLATAASGTSIAGAAAPDGCVSVELQHVPVALLEQTGAVQYLTEHPSKQGKWCNEAKQGSCARGNKCAFAHLKPVGGVTDIAQVLEIVRSALSGKKSSGSGADTSSSVPVTHARAAAAAAAAAASSSTSTSVAVPRGVSPHQQQRQQHEELPPYHPQEGGIHAGANTSNGFVVIEGRRVAVSDLQPTKVLQHPGEKKWCKHFVRQSGCSHGSECFFAHASPHVPQ